MDSGAVVPLVVPLVAPLVARCCAGFGAGFAGLGALSTPCSDFRTCFSALALAVPCRLRELLTFEC